MQKYFAAFTFILLIAMVITRVLTLKRLGIEAMKFGKIDKKDFLIPPFALFYFYMIMANAFSLPTFPRQELLRGEVLSWAGVLLCFAGALLLFWSIVSFRDSFRVGIDNKRAGGLITTGVFAYSRNPIYVSFALFLLGQFFIFTSWILLAYLVAAAWLFHRQVKREEEFLREHFGKKYRDYCKKVRRYF